ncbi:MAG: pilus assembly protein [Actinobacteria bacterium]|jgi:Flp pilus assembly protein TadG|uniref:Unannotated protein n=1 Tax=freshwater metagenome TaxID=449393 RepID=A0A6J6EI77_9ZZZZ|nr:pilus assembly protein [Actinomycetota bacterium]
MRCSAASDAHDVSDGLDASARHHGDRGRLDRGQAVVELALALPVVILVLLGVVQVAVVVRDQLVTQHAAREAARAAAVSASPTTAASRAAAPLGLDDLGVRVSAAGDVVRVEVRSRTRTDVPLIGALVGDVTHRAVAVMAREPP